jgi:hypothetical protein
MLVTLAGMNHLHTGSGVCILHLAELPGGDNSCMHSGRWNLEQSSVACIAALLSVLQVPLQSAARSLMSAGRKDMPNY